MFRMRLAPGVGGSKEPRATPSSAAAGAAIAALSIVPFAGPLLTGVVAEYRTERRFRNVERFANELSERLDGIRASKLDATYGRSSEYAEYIVRAAGLAASAHRESKIELLAAVAAGAATHSVTDLLRDKFLAVADALTTAHVEARREFEGGEMWMRSPDEPLEPGTGDTARRLLHEIMPTHEADELQVIVRDLTAQGLLEDARGSRLGTRSGDIWHITTLGRRFLAFLVNRT